MTKTKAKSYKKGALSDVERFAALGALSSGKTIEEVEDLLNRSHTSRVVKKIAKELATVAAARKMEAGSDLDRAIGEAWEPVVQKVVNQLTKQHQMTDKQANQAITKALKKMDLANLSPSPDVLLEQVQKHNSSLKLFTRFDGAGVIAMNQTSSSADPPNPNKAKGQSILSDCVFNPKTNEVN